MKKPPKFPKPRTDEIFKGLDFEKRSQKPPSEELISRLNQLASKPPFSYRHKVKENDPL
jgi:hypothetical protein